LTILAFESVNQDIPDICYPIEIDGCKIPAELLFPITEKKRLP
jgi:hypothetical protein